MLKERLEQSIEYIRSQTPLKPRVGITLGSGLSSFAEEVTVDTTIPYQDIPHFVPPSVDGHPGALVLGHIKDVPVAILQGRIHHYEGHSYAQVIYPTRVLAYLGIEILVLTNASGGLDPKMEPGQFMVIEDHINLTGTNPLIGSNKTGLGPRFPDMSEPYDRELNNRLIEIMGKRNINFTTGVYCGVTGPTYETAAEVRYLRGIGGHAVGMSTVPETIAAKHMGLRVCGISCITNLATGILNQKVTHEEVKQTAALVEVHFKGFLSEFVSTL